MTFDPSRVPDDWEDPESLHVLMTQIRERNPAADIKPMRHAYFIAEAAHRGQMRLSGEPYITHPLAVTQILFDLHMDEDTMCAALLHDVVEDSEIVTLAQLETIFGPQVAHLIDGVTKLGFKKLESGSQREMKAAETTRTAETLRKMLLAMAKDFRVMVIKLADRLHNMQTLGSQDSSKHLRIARETLDVYAPLAARLGIWQVKWQLEDLAFKYLHPTEFKSISERIAQTRSDRERDIAQVLLMIKERFAERSIAIAEIRGRPKHLYSIYNKMVTQSIPFEEIYDLLAVRIITNSESDCYQALGEVHSLFVPIPGLFFDYIGTPKPNGYQSLHTKVYGPNRDPLEIQIRTTAMHDIAEFGVAAHWTYKEGKIEANEVSTLSGLRQQLLDWSSDAKNSSDFLRSLNSDLFVEQVFVCTPKGDVFDMPRGSTPVDFAFRVHTRLGMTLVGAKINGVMSPLATPLSNGDVVEILTRTNAAPSLDWLEFVKSAHARSKLRAHFRKITREQDAARGRDLLEKELKSQGLEPKRFVGDDKLEKLVPDLHGVENAQDLLAKVGGGLLTVQRIIQRLKGETGAAQEPQGLEVTKSREGKLQLADDSMKGTLISRSNCCYPIPGDDVIGYVSRGRGIVLHRRQCPNVARFTENEPERLMQLRWPADGNVYGMNIRIVTVNRQGLLAEVSNIFGETKTNISAASIRTKPNNTAEIDITADVSDTAHLANLMLKISSFSDVITILRLDGKIHR